MNNIFLHKVIPIFTALIVLTGCLVVPAFAFSYVSGDTVTWDGELSSDWVYMGTEDYADFYFGFQFVSPSLPDQDFIMQTPVTVTMYTGPEEPLLVQEITPDSFSFLDPNILSINGLAFIVYVAGTYDLEGSSITFPSAGTYLVAQKIVPIADPSLSISGYTVSLQIPGFVFEPIVVQDAFVESIYYSIYEILGYFFYGGTQNLSAHMDLTLTILATTACVFAVALPFMLVFAFFKRWF